MAKLFSLAIAALLASAPVSAASRSAVLAVHAYLVPTVTVSTTPIVFGGWTTVDPGTSPEGIWSSGGITVTAPKGMSYVITLDAGLHYDGAHRNVENAGYTIRYDMMDPGRTNYWGDAGYANTTPDAPLVGEGTGFPATYAPNGFLYTAKAPRDAPAGVFSDYITVTLYY